MPLAPITPNASHSRNIIPHLSDEIVLQLEFADFVRQGIELSFGHVTHFERLVELQPRTNLSGFVFAYTAELEECITHWLVFRQELA
jgi:hypothetical protein